MRPADRVACATLSTVPLTFLAHQAPVLPLKMRDPRRWDGLGLVVGSMAPDLAYVSSGFGYVGTVALYFSGHRLQNLLLLALFGTLLTVVVRRLVLPVAPLLLPDGADANELAGAIRLEPAREIVGRERRSREQSEQRAGDHGRTRERSVHASEISASGAAASSGHWKRCFFARRASASNDFLAIGRMRFS